MAFLGFGKRRKPNLTPDISFPSQEQLYFTGEDATKGGFNLRDITSRRLKGQDLGFGEQFLNRVTSPAIASREARFRETELPEISSQLSARGLARSAGPNLATDVITRAGQSKERDINELIAKFQVLNEQQKKADFGEALEVSQNLQKQQAGMLADQALASEMLVGRTVDRATQLNKEDAQRREQALSVATAVAGAPFIGGLGSSIGGLLGRAFGQGASPKTNILGGLSNDDFLNSFSRGSKFSVNRRMPISRYY